ncbi:MAG: zinc-dependent alcohol dehydrogenase family protein [Anaerolineales bacterium]
MKAMLLRGVAPLSENPNPLALSEIPDPQPAEGEALIRVSACGVCHTELDEIEGRTPPPHLPVVLGHQVVGIIEKGPDRGQRVGVGWIHSACGTCHYCMSGNENLCEQFEATGRDANGGYAQYMTVPREFAYRIPDALSDSEAAPLLCAGAVGYRALRLANVHDGDALGLTGFGASNHLVLKTALHKYPNSPVFVFSRNPQERELALEIGAAWAGAIDEVPPGQMGAAIDATPVWKPIMEALKHLRPGGRMVINAIRKEELDKEELLKLDFSSQLWLEKEIKSVANVARQDIQEFLELAAGAGIRPEFQEFALEDANQALLEVKQGKIRGAKVLRVA